MAEKSLRFGNSFLNFEAMGTGENILLAFHGFGQDHNAFRTLASALSETYTLYIFDLYFHGKSAWGYGEQPLEKLHWTETINTFLTELAIEKFSLLGFSLGGKFVLAILEAFPERTKSVFLLAPDGIKTSLWYSLATYPILFRKIFKSFINHGERFEAVTHALSALGIMDKGLIRFVAHQMNTTEKRQSVYYSWVVFRRLSFNMKVIAMIVNTNAIPLSIITGKYDKVIMPKNMHRLLKHLKTYRLEILETGHNGLIAESAPYLLIDRK